MYKDSEMAPIEDRKLFVGGLGWDSTEKELNEYFSKFGDVESINVKTNPSTGRSRGFAFIVFANSGCIDQILDGSDHFINGRKVDAKKAIARTGKIFVGGLKEEISDDDIKDFFSQFGKVIDVKIPFDRQRNQRKGFCFITFEEEHVVNELLRNPQQIISGISVDLRKATPKNDSMNKGYGGDRGGGGGGNGSGSSGGRGARRWQGYGGNHYGSTPYSGYNYNYDSYGGYGDGYSNNYNSGYNYSNYSDQTYADGQSGKDGSQQSRYQPY